jgi:outer membrane protein W
MRTKRTLVLAVGLALVGAFSASARAEETVEADHGFTPHFKLYAGPAYVASMSDSDITLGTVSDSVKAEKQVGWNLGFEGRFNKLLGIEIDYVNADQDVSFGGSTIGDATFSPLTATLNFHIVPLKHFDLYLGPSYSYVNWGDIHLNANGGTITGGSTIGTASAHNWGVSLGFDVAPWKHFAFYAGLKYLNVDLEMDNGQTADVKPLVARLGAAIRF